ncbi:hypothetical protein GCK72_018684 [Caenorhabditis remanei]|uniref:Acyltransferase 3 domain-containing protein n=1 Tax=Caenorhabditis remanei TaxID=31234 RepID=A0A6A5GAU7_CAERE|nr:hypothetical protein GCK72_018684 [Caenorhabditis remanei]KAF1752130.1 hypothetical protein GCK72_018684 [Caenorhabditis remanei]
MMHLGRFRLQVYLKSHWFLMEVIKNASCAGGNINNIGTTIAFRRAVCMPDSCGSSDTVNLYNQLTGLPLTACATFCAHRDVPKDVALWGFTTFLVAILTFAVLATTVDFLRESLYSITSKTVETTFSFFRVLYAFSFWTNAGSILNVSPQPSTHIKCLDCLRGISMAWVLSAHMLNYFAFSDTLMPIKSFADYFADSFFINANFSVDTFFLISGITVAYSFFKLKPTPKTLKSPSTWILFYVHRYIRLTPPYMIFIGFYAVYSLYIQGPLAASLFNFTVLQVEACKASWWRNLVYINNFDNGENPCYGPSWYLAVDTQLYLIAPILLVALAWKPISGVLLSLIGCVGSMITVFVLYFKFDNMTADSFHSDPSGKFNFYLYQKPWIRCPPYLVGILVGYLLAKRPPPTRLAMWKKVILIIISIGLPFTCLTANRGYDEGKQQLQRWFVKATYYNFSRFLWSTSVAYIVMACHYGWAGPIGNFMNHPIWQPLGRLSYSAYIVHLMVVYYFLNVGDKPLHFVSTWQVYVYYILPATILTFAFAFFWSCLFEVPIVKLEKFLLEVLLKKKVKPETSRGNDIVEEFFSYSSVFLVIVRSDRMNLPVWFIYIGDVLFCGMFGMSMAMFALHFVYRYLVVTGNVYVKTLNCQKLIVWLLAPLLYGTLWITVVFTTLHPNEYSDRILNNHYLPGKDLIPEEKTYVGPNYYIGENDKESLNWNTIIGMTILDSMVTVSVIIIIIFATKCYKIVRDLAQSFQHSKNYRDLQAQLLNSLVAQMIIPAILMQAPALYLFTFPILNMGNELVGKLFCIAVAIYPVIDPLPTMLMIQHYRNALIDTVTSNKKNQAGQKRQKSVKSMPANVANVDS